MKKYLKHRITNLVDIKELMAIEYLDFAGKYAHYSESHNFWELCFVENGKLNVRIGTRHFTARKNQIFFVAPDSDHSYEAPPPKNSCKAFVVCFECQSQVLQILEKSCIDLREDQISLLRCIIAEAKNTFRMNDRDLLEIVEHPNLGGGQMIVLHLEHLLVDILREIAQSNTSGVIFLEKENFHAGLVKGVLEYFQEHIREKISLDDVCRKMNYSRSFLCKIFKQQTGESLLTCFNRMKIEEAKKLLLETDLPAAKISDLLGFTDAKYFNTLFKKFAGKPPVIFRDTTPTA